MVFRVALCDDYRPYLELVRDKILRYCREHQRNIVLDVFEDSDRLSEYTEEKKLYDAYILDIEMPNGSGLCLAEKIRNVSETAYIIFLTAFESYAVQACGMNVLSYILKERMEEELDQVLDRLFLRLDREKGEIFYTISNQRKYIKFLHRDILYIYKQQKNAVFVLDEMEEEWERISLQEVARKLHNPALYCLDRGVIVNLRHVQKVVDDRILIKGGHELQTSRIHVNELKEALLTYWGNLV